MIIIPQAGLARDKSKSECKSYLIRYTHNKKIHQERKRYCLDFKLAKLTDEKCQDLKCLNKVSGSYEELSKGRRQNFGTMGFHICHKLYGRPQVIKAQNSKGKWRTFDRCRIDGVGTVDTVTLVKFLRER